MPAARSAARPGSARPPSTAARADPDEPDDGGAEQHEREDGRVDRPSDYPVQRSSRSWLMGEEGRRKGRKGGGSRGGRPARQRGGGAAQRTRARERAGRGGGGSVKLGRLVTDERADVARLHDNGVDPGPLEREHVVARGGGEVATASFPAGRPGGARGRGRGSRRRVAVPGEEEDLGIDRSPTLELLLVAHLDDDVEAEARARVRGRPRARSQSSS